MQELIKAKLDPTKLDMWTDLKIRLYNLGRSYDIESLSSQQEAIEQQIEEIINFLLEQAMKEAYEKGMRHIQNEVDSMTDQEVLDFLMGKHK